MQQLKTSGQAGDLIIPEDEEEMEEITVEVNLAEEARPRFLQKFGDVDRATWLQSEFEDSLKISAKPNGSLARVAMAQSALAKERHELRMWQRNQQIGDVPRDLNRAWADPGAAPGDRLLAAEVRGLMTNDPVPKWKEARDAFLLNCVPRSAADNSSDSVGEGGQKKKVPRSVKQQRESLPIYKVREHFLKAVESSQFLVVVGETGSGKSTQIPQYLLEEGYANGFKKMIGCTQPRRIAAVSIAKRVAEERGCRVGEEIGYSIRFEDCTSPATRVKYMTEALLLRECLPYNNSNNSHSRRRMPLENYSVLIIDEAHERSVNTDVLLGLIKGIAKDRPDLKVIVASATLEASSFSSYFNECPIFYVRGRDYRVDTFFVKEPETDYLDAALITVMQIHLSEPEGDILCFLTGQEEIDSACEILHERMCSLGPLVPELIVLPVYAALPCEQQQRIFAPTPKGKRKVVIATNIAETSLTVEGIVYVVDPGFVKQKWWNPKTRRDSLVVVPISRAAAKQRAGRAGRTCPGKAYRLYTQEAFDKEMNPSDVPEIMRTDLSSTILTLKALGVEDLMTFDFMPDGRPSVPAIVAALDKLYCMGALDEDGLLTSDGRRMASFPLDPSMARMLLASVELGCVSEILTIAAMLSVPNIFHRPKQKQEEADRKRRAFFRPEGDHLTLMAVFDAWKAAGRNAAWCRDKFIDARAMRQAENVRMQLASLLHGMGLMFPAEGGDTTTLTTTPSTCGGDYSLVCRAICRGFFRNVARKERSNTNNNDGDYKDLVDGQPCFLHPSSCLFHVKPEWLLYHEVTFTSKEYMRCVCVVEPMWLVEGSGGEHGSFYRVVDPKEHQRGGAGGKRKREEKLEPLFNYHLQDQNA